MKLRYVIVLATTFLQCRATAPPPVLVPAAPPPAPVDAPIATAPKPPPVPSRAIVFGGAGKIVQAAWVAGGVVAVTRTEVWRFAPEKRDVVRITPLAGPINGHEVIAATPSSALVAVALDDSSVDVLDEAGRKITIAAPPKATDILSLRFSPDQSTLAVTRNASWKEETTFYDVASGKALGAIEGGNVVFDPTGKYVAGRGGVFTIEGKSLFTFKEGFYVLGINGKMTPIDKAGGEVMAGDHVARGFFRGSFFFAGDKSIELFDPGAGTASSIAAACSPRTKGGSEADAAQGRVIATCDDGVLITDLAARTTRKLKATIKRSIFPPDVFIPPGSPSFLIRDGGSNVFVDPRAGVARDATYEEITGYHARAGEALCAHGTPRTAIRCDIPAARPDGAYKLQLHDGLTIVDAGGRPVVDWTTYGRTGGGFDYVFHRGAIELRSTVQQRTLAFRLDGAPPGGPDPGEPFTADGCGKLPDKQQWNLRDRSDTFAAFTAMRSAKGYAVAEVLCLCRAEGCTTRDLPNTANMAESLAAIGEDGSTLSISINSYQTETDVYLRRPKKPAAHAKIPAACIHGAIGPGGRVFMSCQAVERNWIWELGATDLAIVGKRIAPPLGGRGDEIERMGDDILVHGADAAALLPADWVKDATSKERATLFVSYEFVLSLRPDGTITVVGDMDSASKIARCYDGTRLKPFAECRADVLAR